jgi:hypothetical protein
MVFEDSTWGDATFYTGDSLNVYIKNCLFSATSKGNYDQYNNVAVVGLRTGGRRWVVGCHFTTLRYGVYGVGDRG